MSIFFFNFKLIILHLYFLLIFFSSVQQNRFIRTLSVTKHYHDTINSSINLEMEFYTEWHP